MPCPLNALAHRLLQECDGDWASARQRVEQIELCHIDNDCVGLVDIFDRIAPSYGAQSVEGQAVCLVAKYGADAPRLAARLMALQAPFPRLGLHCATVARLAFVCSAKAVRR
jgi:hypothetical protein